MKRRLLDVVTLGTVLFSPSPCSGPACFRPPRRRLPRQAEVHGTADPYGTQSAMRYRRCQENHWRACILQH